MIKNKINSDVKQSVSKKSTTTSPISKSYTSKSGKSDGFMAWLRDEETDGILTPVGAVTSFVRGLFEIIKTVYKKPVLCSFVIVGGIFLTTVAQSVALPAIMWGSVVSGVAAIAYSMRSIATRRTNLEKKQAIELMGIATFVLAIGIFGLIV